MPFYFFFFNFRNTIRVSIGFDPVQNRHYVGSVLDLSACKGYQQMKTSSLLRKEIRRTLLKFVFLCLFLCVLLVKIITNVEILCKIANYVFSPKMMLFLSAVRDIYMFITSN